MDLLFSSKYYHFFLAKQARIFHINFGNKLVDLSFCQLLALRQKLNAIDIEHHFDSELNTHGFEILTLCNKEHLFVLNTFEILDLIDLVNQSFMLLENPQTKVSSYAL